MDPDRDPTLPVWSDYTSPEYEEALSRSYDSGDAPTTEIFQGECTRAYGFARRHGISHASALDFMQDYSIRVMTIWTTRSCDPDRSIGAYLQGVLINLLLDIRRKAQTRNGRIVSVAFGDDEDDGGAPEPSSTELEPLDAMIAEDSVERILRRIDNAENRTIVRLRYLDRRSSKDIAKLLGLTPGAVNIRMTRTRQALQEQLKDVTE